MPWLLHTYTLFLLLPHCLYYITSCTTCTTWLYCHTPASSLFVLLSLWWLWVWWQSGHHLWLSLILFNKSFINYNVERTRWLCDCINLTFYNILHHWPSTYDGKHHSLLTPPDWRVANDFCFRCRTVFTTEGFWKGLDCFSASVHVSCFMKIAGSLAIILTVVKMTGNDGWRICPVQTWIPATDIIFRDFLFLIRTN